MDNDLLFAETHPAILFYANHLPFRKVVPHRYPSHGKPPAKVANNKVRTNPRKTDALEKTLKLRRQFLESIGLPAELPRQLQTASFKIFVLFRAVLCAVNQFFSLLRFRV